MAKETVMLIGGGTAGHITPLLAITKSLYSQRPNLRIVFVIDRNSLNEQLVIDSGLPVVIRKIFSGKYRRFHNHSFVRRLLSVKINILNARDIFYVIIGFVQSLGLQLRYHPRVVFSKGSFVAVPMLMAAVLFNRKIITHDSDSVVGLANKLFYRFSIINAVGVLGDEDSNMRRNKIIHTGVPVGDEFIARMDQDIKKSKQDVGIKEDSLLLLIGGSTLGAKVVDDEVEKIIPQLLENFAKLEVVHIFGRLNEHSIQSRYKNVKEKYSSRLHLKTFTNEQHKYAAAADIVITRAGATAMTEYGVLSKACIVIPAKQLSGGHQVQNAAVYKKKNAAIIVDQDEIKETLYERVVYLLQHANERDLLGKNLHNITIKDSATRIASLIIKGL